MKLKNFFASALSVILAAAMLVSCKGNTPKEGCYVNGVSLEKYVLVYDGDDLYSEFAAESLKNVLDNRYGVSLQAVSDEEDESKYEILVGDTNRIITDADTGEGLEDDQYIVEAEKTKILLVAKGYMIGGAAGGFADLLAEAKTSGKYFDVKIEDQPTAATYVYKEAKSALLYIGDGMGANHIRWAKQEGMAKFYAEDMPHIGEATTFSANSAVTDSAASGTALATGHKTNNSMIGMTPNGQRVENIREIAFKFGAHTAVITTDTKTGATPAAFTAHVSNRTDELTIENQQTYLEREKRIDYLYGSVGSALLKYSQKCLKDISINDEPFFMMLEEGYIDKHSHSNGAFKMQKAVERFNETIAYAMMFTLVRGDVLFVVTSDHETGGVTETDGSFEFTTTSHTGVNVRVFAMGDGSEYFGEKTVDNTDIPKRLAIIYGDAEFGD